jgi:hypothetical protein
MKTVHEFQGSSDVKKYTYDNSTLELTVYFKRGGVYTYLNVPPSVPPAWAKAKSAGTYFHANIKSYAFRKGE